MTFIEKFDYFKKKYALKADPSKIKDDFIAAQITMSDEDCGGTFYAAYINGTFSFEPYDYHDNTVAMIISSQLLEDCINGKADPAKNYLEGNLQAWGNLDHALQLVECLKGKKKAPARKKAEPKEADAEDKKPARKACRKKAAEEVKTEEVTEAKTKKAASKKTPAKKTAEKEN